MIYISTWVEKLEADLKTLSPKTFVGFGRDMPDLRNSKPKKLPAVFVLPLSDTVRPIDSTQTTGDYIRQFVEVVYICRDVKEDHAESLDSIRDVVHGSLLNWSPEGSVYPCHRERGARTGYKAGMIAWSDVFVLEFVRTA